MRSALILLVFLFFFALSPALVFAQKDTQPNEDLNSFELFWPLVAGKTKGDKWYSLKLFKEQARGFLIFGKPQKADYSLFLATKRILEAEKLFKDGNKDYSIQTFDMALSQLKVVEESIDNSGDSIKATVDGLNNKFDNLEIFLPWLKLQYKDKDLEDKTDIVLDKVISLHSKI